jgi:uncharacterized protein YcgL (UPF0745 family)
MLCDIYIPKHRRDIHVVLPAGVSPEVLPMEVRTQLGALLLFKRREIRPGLPLIGANPDEVLDHINRQGFYLGGVRIQTQVSEAGGALGGGLLGAALGGPVGAVIGAVAGYVLAHHAKKGDADAKP